MTFGDTTQLKPPSSYAKAFVKRCMDERPDLKSKPMAFIDYCMHHPEKMYEIDLTTIDRYRRLLTH